MRFTPAVVVLFLLVAVQCQAQRNPMVEVTVAKRGTITIELFQKDAPKTVAHILALVKSGFYNGMVFHRVVPDFVVQCGDPTSKKWSDADILAKDDGQGGTDGLGSGGSGKTIPFETNSQTHEEGTLGIALSGPRTNTGDSQWFINLKPNHRLDGDYCVFGKVVKGMDVVKRIKRGDRITKMAVVEPARRK